MTTVIITTIVLLFVVGVIAFVAFGVYECTPFAHQENPYRNHTTGRRRWESPHLD